MGTEGPFDTAVELGRARRGRRDASLDTMQLWRLTGESAPWSRRLSNPIYDAPLNSSVTLLLRHHGSACWSGTQFLDSTALFCQRGLYLSFGKAVYSQALRAASAS